MEEGPRINKGRLSDYNAMENMVFFCIIILSLDVIWFIRA
jgi:hypothetical protein